MGGGSDALVFEGLGVVQHALYALANLRAKVILNAGYILGKTAKDQTAKDSYTELARAMLFFAERGRHATLALDAFLEGNAGQISLSVVAPGVIDALETIRTARAERERAKEQAND